MNWPDVPTSGKKAGWPMNSEVRYSRQRDLVPADRLSGCTATVIGVGSIGRQVAIQLAAMGVPWLQLVDLDVVNEVNLAGQGYLETDLGRFKVEATGELCQRINSDVQLEVCPERYRRSMDVGDVLFIAVDRIEIRQLIWNTVANRVRFMADGRMTAEVLRILVACDEYSRRHYPSTLFTAEEVYTGSCTAKTTIYCANIAAGFMLAQFAKWLRGLPVEADLSLNLLASELSMATGGSVPSLS